LNSFYRYNIIIIIMLGLDRVLMLRFFPSFDSPSEPGPLHYQAARSHLRLTTLGRDRLDEWSTRRWDLCLTQHSLDSHAPSVIRNLSTSKRAAADPRFRPRSHWDRLCCNYYCLL